MIVVRDCMTSPATTESSDSSTLRLLDLLERRKISAVPIVDKGRLVGIVSTTDLVRDLAAHGANESARTAADCMRHPVVTAAPDEPIEAAAERMVSARVHRLVVTERDEVVGILSTRDILGEVFKFRPQALLGQLMTSPVETIDIDASVDNAVSRLVEANVHGLVVVDVDTPVGVFTHAEALASRRLPPVLRARPVEEVMSYETICLEIKTPVFRAVAHAIQMNVRRLLVVDHRRLVGILSCLDLVAVLSTKPIEAKG
jgi:CBS domain-containing protein